MSYGSVTSETTINAIENEFESRSLLGEEDVKVDMPEVPQNHSQEANIPDDFLKTLASVVFLGCGFIACCISIALVHERKPDYDPLPDVILDYVQNEKWALRVSESLVVINIVLAASTVLLHHHRMVVFRRIFLILGLIYFYRSITMYVTALPKPGLQNHCAPKLNHTITSSELMNRVYFLLYGGGLSLAEDDVYCGDYIFSGHTAMLLMSFFVIRECK